VQQAAAPAYKFTEHEDGTYTLTLFSNFPRGTNLDGLNETNIPEFADGRVYPSSVTTLVIEGDAPDLTNDQVSGIKSRRSFPFTGLAHVSLPNFTGTIPESAFGWRGLGVQQTWLESFSAPLATSIGSYAFEGCTALTGPLDFPEVTKIGYYAFSSCPLLTCPLNFPEVTEIEDGAFSNCTGLTGSLSFLKVTKIGSSAFSYCTGLDGTLDFPEATRIGSDAFRDCTSLTGIHLPKAYSFGNSVFINVSNCTLRFDSPAGTISFGTGIVGMECFNNSSTMTLQLGTGAQPARPTTLPAMNTAWNGYTWGRIEAYQQP
jgi:hypothetical protein